MARYTKKELIVLSGLRKIINDQTKSAEVRRVAKDIINDKDKFAEYVLLKEKRLEANRRKKILEERKKNLTGWKKWFIRILPEGLILR
ncbi:MAG: hypothetical protein R3220_09150 [Balneolaceae bacterium]|nr:hypothetical protein [Balneolaceae bacterium]